MTDPRNYGTLVRRFIQGQCPQCQDLVSLKPGPLSDDGEWELRICDENEAHIVPWPPLFRCPPGEATEFFE